MLLLLRFVCKHIIFIFCMCVQWVCMDAMTEKVSFRCFVKMQLHFILFGLLHYIDKSSHVNCFVKKNSYLSCLYVIALSEP